MQNNTNLSQTIDSFTEDLLNEVRQAVLGGGIASLKPVLEEKSRQFAQQATQANITQILTQFGGTSELPAPRRVKKALSPATAAPTRTKTAAKRRRKKSDEPRRMVVSEALVEAALDVVKKAKEPISTKDVAKKLGKNQVSVSTALNNLTDQKKVRQVKEGARRFYQPIDA